MLTINVPSSELYDEVNNEFIQIKGRTIKLEHSLLSLSKWESKWCKPFLSIDTKDRPVVETMDYIRCMTIGQELDLNFYYGLSQENIKIITDYINMPMTATTFNKRHTGQIPGKKEIITSEIIYYDMISLGIPFECEKWHLNRLFTLIRVCSIKNSPGKKMSKQDAMRRQRALNAQRKARYHTKG